jgi:hypothetical protein
MAMKELISSTTKVLFCLILIMSACTGKDNSGKTSGSDTANSSVNYNDPMQRDSAHVDSSFRNGLGH